MTDEKKGDPMEGWISTAEAARRLGLTARRVRQLIDEGELEGRLMHPRLLLVKEESVQAYRPAR